MNLITTDLATDDLGLDDLLAMEQFFWLMTIILEETQPKNNELMQTKMEICSHN
jgi:hypothetical protein